jgi:hypothetical protein
MESKKLEMIMKLMEELQDEMQYGEEDFSSRLGRKKPEIEVVRLEGEMPLEESDEMGMADDMGEEMDESPEMKLKSRLKKLRGA